MIASLFKKDRRVGSTSGKRRYDLPLDHDAGSSFLALLIGLMTFLAVMSLGASFVLDGVTQRWTSGLENRLTVEIPAASGDQVRGGTEMDALARDAGKALEGMDSVRGHEIMSEDEVRELLKPWLGEGGGAMDDLPLPRLISVELAQNTAASIHKIESRLKAVDESISIDTHETWLNSLLRLTGSLKLAAASIALFIGLTAVTALAEGVRTRMALHRDDVELLHLMGANDLYITRQFQRHAFTLALKGSIGGVLAAALLIGALALFSRESALGDLDLLPALTMRPGQIASILAVPALACLIASVTARVTVLRTLSSMP